MLLLFSIIPPCSDQLVCALSKKIQWKDPEFAFRKYSALFGALRIEKIANGHLVAGTRLYEIVGHTPIDTSVIQTDTVDANHIYKARYSVQLSI